MSYEFHHGSELLTLCSRYKISIGEVMLRREMEDKLHQLNSKVAFGRELVGLQFQPLGGFDKGVAVCFAREIVIILVIGIHSVFIKLFCLTDIRDTGTPHTAKVGIIDEID